MSPKPLRRHALTGAGMTVAARVFRAFQGIAALAILSRYLTPTEFGLIAMVGFVAGLAMVFTDFGTRVALVQRKDVTPLEEDSVFWWNLGLGAVLTAIIMGFAPQIARLMGEEAMTTPLRWIAPIFVMGALQGVPLSMLERRFAFGRIATAEVAAALSGSAVAIAMVLLGYKLEALVAQSVTGPLVAMMVVVASARWRPRLQFSYAALKPLLAYGGYVTSAGVVQMLSTKADRPIVGNRLSATDLGYSAITEQIVYSPLRITVQMVRKVMFPIMATIQDDDVRMRRGYIAMQHGLMIVMAPVALGLWVVAEPVVDILLGDGWDMVAVLMGYLTIRSVFSTFNDINAVIFSAKGWARFQFHWSIFSAILTIGTLLVTVNYGIEAVVAGKLFLNILLTPFNSYFALRLIGQPAGEVIAVLARPIISAGIMAAVVFGVQTQLTVGPMV
jgi:O-antigen/teichoic acid export membrane protein